MANRSKNIFAYLDSDDEDVPKVSKKAEAPSSAPVALNKPAAGNKKTPKKAFVEDNKGDKKAPRDGARREQRAPREGGAAGAPKDRAPRSARGPRREFERRSGTGRGKETSKQGGGARNWGNDNDQAELVAEAAVQENPKDGEEAGEEAPVEEEEEEVQLSYEEYLAKKKESRSGELFAEVEVRQVTNEFTNAVQITKDGKTPDFIEPSFEKVFSKKTSGRKKQLVTDLGFQAPAPERHFREETGGRGGRGGRGAPRGGREGRGRGAGRSGRGSAAPNVTDLKAFPSLG